MRFIEDKSFSIIDNNKLTIDRVGYLTLDELASIEMYLKELKTEDEKLLRDPYGYKFIFKKYKFFLSRRKNLCAEELEENFPDSKFSPYTNLYLQIAERCKNLGDQEFLITLKEGLDSEVFKKKVVQQRKYTSEYKKEVRNYINGLFEYRSRLLVIRIDLSYRKGLLVTPHNEYGFFKRPSKPGMNTPFTSPTPQKLRFLKDWLLDVQKHRTMLIKQLKRQYSKDFVGYVWKLEYTEEKSFHYHMMFFLDGSKHREDVVIAQNIGELWVSEITQGIGLYWNCNAFKDKYRNPGMGMISHHETFPRDNMLNTAFYLVKKDYFIRSIMFDSKNRAFGKGQIPGKSKSGRPRKK
ncbi:YagK/YfjJ domain-containing protein [Acinetobacter chinensis]|nr:inovirus-type Gp2 protein [Acinetobacter chinensis]